MKKTTSKTRRTPNYVPVASNVYYDGSSYRVRASVNGTRVSKNFGSKRNAINYRNQLLKTA